MAVYPAGLPRPIDASLARSESSYVSTSQRHSGTPFYSINADDAPMTFGLTWRFTRSQMAAFRDWLESDNFAVLNGEQFDINLPTDTGIILQSVSFSPDAAPRIDAITGWVYTVSATVIARSYAENIPALSFKTPDNEFAYYFYSQYEYPDILPNPVDSGYRKAEAQRFNLGDVSSGAFSREIQTDDSPAVYDLTITLPINLEPIFRAWLAQDNFNMLKGAPFNMPIVTEYGVLLQVVQFVDGGQPQQSGMTLNTKTYTAKVTARKQMNSPEGLTDATLGPQVVVSMLYPFFVEENLSMSSGIKAGGGLSPPLQEFMAFSSMILAGGEIAGLPVVDYDLGNEDLNFSSIILAGGEVKNIRVDYDNGDPEELAFGSIILAGGEVNVIAIRYNMAEFDAGELTLSSSILTGGTVG